MKTKSILIAGGTAALGLALIALPGHSVPRIALGSNAQEPMTAPAPPDEPGTPKVDRVERMVISLDGDSSSWLGVETREVNADKVKDLKLPAERGVLIGKVMPDSPAAKAGLKENDVVTEINGQAIEGSVQFRRVIREIPAGRKIQLTVWRDGHSQKIEATLGKSEENIRTWTQAAPRSFAYAMPAMPEIPDIPKFEWSEEGGVGVLSMGRPRLGIEAEDLDGQLGSFFGAPNGEGILVRSVNSESPAEKGGIKAGDVITSVNGETIHGVGELREKLGSGKEAKSVKIGLLRNKAAMTLTVELPASKPLKVKRIEKGAKI